MALLLTIAVAVVMSQLYSDDMLRKMEENAARWRYYRVGEMLRRARDEKSDTGSNGNSNGVPYMPGYGAYSGR